MAFSKPAAVAAVLFSISVFCETAHAQGRSISLIKEVTLPDEPVRATMTVTDDKRIIATIPAMILRTSKENVVRIAGRVEVPAESHDIVTLVAVTTVKGGVVGVSFRGADLESDGLAYMDSVGLKRRLEERKELLKGWESQLSQQEGNLDRLQQDADVIANVGRIVDAEDELGAIQADQERLSATLQVAKARLAALKEIPSPSNFQRREAELSSYLAQSSRVLKEVDTSAVQRLNSAEASLQQKVALIDATKNEHVDLLEKELARVRREREILESSVTRVDPETPQRGDPLEEPQDEGSTGE